MEYIDAFGLVDTFRERNPETKRYTWHRKIPHKQARLDYILISDSLLPSLTSSIIEPGYRSDNSFSIINLSLNNFKRGKGLWKFNNSLLFDNEFLNFIESTIENIKSQFAVPVYNIDNIKDISSDLIVNTINDQLFFRNSNDGNSG